MGKVNICPVILSHSLSEIQIQVDKVKKISTIKKIQIDIIDGNFVDNLTVTPHALSNIDFGNIVIDMHLMVREPVEFLGEIELLKEKVQISSIIAQVEQMSSQEEFIQLVKKMNCQPGLSLNLFTPLSVVEFESWKRIKQIQLLGVEAGFQGQNIKEIVYKKIRKCKKYIKQNSYFVELLVDGGIKLNNTKKLIECGVDELVIGSAFWNSTSFDKTYLEFFDLTK